MHDEAGASSRVKVTIKIVGVYQNVIFFKKKFHIETEL